MSGPRKTSSVQISAPSLWTAPWIGASAAAILWLPKFYLFVAANVLATFIAIMGLVILTGHSGQISIGHGAFVGFGAYACAILIGHAGMPYWIALPLAGAATYLVGFLFGYPALRLEGIYIALATFALAITFPQLVKWRPIQELTGGAQGLVLDRPESPLPALLAPDQWLFAFTATVAGVMLLLAAGISRSALALHWKALRDHRIAAETTGISRRRSYNHAFAFSALYAGVAGGLGVIQTQFISPESFSFFLSLTLLAGAVVGGIGSLAGAFVGALFVQLVPNLSESISKAAPAAIYGAILLVILAKAPDGVAGAAAALWRRRRGVRPTGGN
jgi:branched-chain amino acid transport system permease protein